tara:strand:- start:14729 stop:15280 length:552 start_codon:yes stop_codon:yes gene_type:complete
MHSTNNLDDGYMGSGKRLRRSIRKYGEDNHTKEVVAFYDSRELLIEAEKEAITPEMVTDNDCMNLKEGGTGGWSSEEHRIKAQKSSRVTWKKRLDEDAEFRELMKSRGLENLRKYNESGACGLNFKGKEHTEETKEKMRKPKNMGKANSQYGTCWITKDGSNKKIKKEDLDTYLEEGWMKGRK